MPVSVVRRGDEWCVVEPNGTQIACHDTEAGARRQQQAINANLEGKGAIQPQDEVNYVTQSASENQACGTCKWFYANAENPCMIILNEPEKIVAAGHCTRWNLRPEEPAKAKAYAIKAKGENGFCGYTAVWGDPDTRDLEGEYFTPETDFALEAYKSRPLIHHHGHNRHMERTITGTIHTWRKDDVGLYVEGEFKRLSDDVELFDEEERRLRAEYIRRLQDKIAAGELNFSSGAVSHLVKYGQDGEIKQWWWAESSTTGTPAEPRLTDVRLLKACKGLNIEIPEEAEKDGIDPSPAIDTPQEVAVPGENGNQPETNQQPDVGELTMTPEEMAAQILASIEELSQVSPEMAAQLIERAREMMAAEEEAVAANNPEDLENKDTPAMTEDEKLVNWLIQPEKMVLVIKAAQDMFKPAVTPAQVATAITAAKATRPPIGAGGVDVAPGYQEKRTAGLQMRTKYERAGWEADDFTFYAMLKKQFHPGWTPSVEFARMATQAALKQVDGFQMKHGLDEKAMMFLRRDAEYAAAAAVKADELEHTTQSGYGLEWQEQSYSSSIFEKARVNNVAAQLFRRENMPTSPHTLRLEGTDPTVVAVPETTDQSQLTWTSNNPITMTKVGTASTQMVAGKLGIYFGMSEEDIDDVNLDVVNFKRNQAEKVFREAIDAVLLNADASANGNINYNGAALADESMFRYGGGDGILHSPLVENTNNAVPMGAIPSVEALWTLEEKLLTAYGVARSDLVFISDVRSWQMLRRADDLLTVDKYGDKATILNGEVASLAGVPFLVSDQIKASAADGFISSTPANNTKGRIVCMYKPNWFLGERKSLNLRVKELEWDSTVVIGTLRMAIAKFDIYSASVLYNITITQ